MCRALCLYAALTIIPGIAVHLGAEAFAIGGTESPMHFFLRHAYLVLIAFALFGAARHLVADIPENTRRRALVGIFNALPWRGSRLRAYFASVIAQCAFYVTTFGLEIHALSLQKCGFSLFVATLCALFAAFFLSALPTAVVGMLAALHVLRDRRLREIACGLHSRAVFRRLHRCIGDYLAVAGNRPPPRVVGA